MKKWICMGLALVLLGGMLSGCAPRNAACDIAATTLPVYEFTTRLCAHTGLTVTRLVTEKVSCLHDYSLSVRQVKAIQGAKLLVLSGAGLEDFLSDGVSGAQALADASEGIPLHCGDAHEEEAHGEAGHHHEYDPHIWLSPVLAKKMVQNICAALKAQFPGHREVFERNLAALNADLDAILAYGKEALGELDCRKLLTFHDGFSYLAEAFDLTILEAVEEESGSEASAQKLISLIGLVESQNLPAIFTEVSGSTAAAEVIAAETGVKVFSLDMALSGDSYFTAMYRNIDTLQEALK